MPAPAFRKPAIQAIQARDSSKNGLAKIARWLAYREHVKANLRRTVPRYRSVRGLLDRVGNLFVPWAICEYPGFLRWAGDVLGVKSSTARYYTRYNVRLPEKHARTLAALCEGRAAELQAVAADLRAHADLQRATVEPVADVLRRVALERSQGLRDRRGRLKAEPD